MHAASRRYFAPATDVMQYRYNLLDTDMAVKESGMIYSGSRAQIRNARRQEMIELHKEVNEMLADVQSDEDSSAVLTASLTYRAPSIERSPLSMESSELPSLKDKTAKQTFPMRPIYSSRKVQLYEKRLDFRCPAVPNAPVTPNVNVWQARKKIEKNHSKGVEMLPYTDNYKITQHGRRQKDSKSKWKQRKDVHSSTRSVKPWSFLPRESSISTVTRLKSSTSSQKGLGWSTDLYNKRMTYIHKHTFFGSENPFVSNNNLLSVLHVGGIYVTRSDAYQIPFGKAKGRSIVFKNQKTHVKYNPSLPPDRVYSRGMTIKSLSSEECT